MDHSVRMVVIPEDVYLSLINQNKALSNPIDSHILERSNKMNKILHNPTLDDSKKFQLFSNELKRIQNIKANQNEVPANVNIKNMDSGITEELSRAIAEKIRPEERIYETPAKDRHNQNIDSSLDISEDSANNITDEDDFVTPEKNHSKNTTPSRTPKTVKKNNFEKLRNYLNQNRQKFGIREDGRIFKDSNRRAVFTHSSFEKIVRSLVGLSPTRPHGLRKLLSDLQKDDYAKNLITEFGSPQRGDGKVYAPSLLSSIRKRRFVPNECLEKKSKKRLNFCPEIWNCC